MVTVETTALRVNADRIAGETLGFPAPGSREGGRLGTEVTVGNVAEATRLCAALRGYGYAAQVVGA